MKPQRIIAATLLAGTLLVLVGLVAMWLIIPVAGAALTIALGGALVLASYRMLGGAR